MISCQMRGIALHISAEWVQLSSVGSTFGIQDLSIHYATSPTKTACLEVYSLTCMRYFCQRTLYADVTNWVKNCSRYQTAKGPCVSPNPTQGSIVANNPEDLLCNNFTKMDTGEDRN